MTAVRLDYRIEIPQILAQIHISGLRSFYDECERHFTERAQ